MKKIILLLSGWVGCWMAAPSTAQEMLIGLEIPQQQAAQYYRPYVAVWIEDEQQQPVRLLTVWQDKPDWLKDLRRFWRKTGRSDSALVDGMTGATRGPGRYQLSWDGLDDEGKKVAAGQYVLFVEAAREQGGRSLQRQPFNWQQGAITLQQPAAPELGPLSLTIK
ncbi:DUF2271 domain-containing protein [Arsukibacterium sp.]|uniref:DUF2271 domain-containing protein n=1 Tax=Arsukibacterium sp. TaxID=1977258 RepID=UPI00260DFEB3|nr:DUF2271 domain-containing protein [Arsukibacterium sp.]